ncbi:DoxX family protein [Mariniblastus sp.]|nr:DoxX family protein [Mariniblastus sp.]
MLLRIVIGFHFYKEGTAKLKSGTFSSAGFLSGAKGPMAPLFKQMLDDPDGKQKLCIVEEFDENGNIFYSVDTELTQLIWDVGFADEATDYYGFGSKEDQIELAKQREQLKKKIITAREAEDKTVDTRALEAARAKIEQDILKIREQPRRLQDILEEHQIQLEDWVAANEIELVSHFSTSERLDGFQRDGENKQLAAVYVDSLRDQVDSIRSDRYKKLLGWTSEVTGIWDSYENQVNGLAVNKQAEKAPLKIHRPFDQEYSFSKWVDAVIPWFDTIIGGLLIVGLFSRLASLASASFLFSVVMTQPPWIPGTTPTYFYVIELVALLVIATTSAGRFGGLDYFVSLIGTKSPQLETERQA